MNTTLYNQYKETISDIYTCWEESPLFSINNKICDYLSKLLHIDLNELAKNKRPFFEVCPGGMNYYSEQSASIFNFFMKYAISKMNLENIIEPDSAEMVGLFLKDLSNAAYWFTTSNSDLMKILSQKPDWRNVLFDDFNTNPTELVKNIQLTACMCTEDNEKQICQFIGLMARISKYEIESQFEALYIIIVFSMIAGSKYFDKSIKKLAQEVRDYLFFVLKNGKLLGFRLNTLCPHITKEVRTKEDNTTRFQIIYSFINYDAYCMRFDLPHKGVNYPHINNISPGKLKSCLFSEDEYKSIVNNHPALEKCFIKYGQQYALSENASTIDGTKSGELQNLIDSKEHQNILAVSYSEDTINSLTEILSYCFPDRCCGKIDTTGAFATNVFQYNFAMRNIHAAIICFFKGPNKKTTELLNTIGKMAYYWGIKDNPKLDSFDELSLLLDLLIERSM